jgi:hypothetical protein
MMRNLLEPNAWEGVDERLGAALSGHGYYVIRHAFQRQGLELVRSSLLAHWAWRYRNWTDAHLTNIEIGADPLVRGLIVELIAHLPNTLRPMRAVDVWSIIFNENVSLGPHADHGDLSIVIWLTPNHHNSTPASGGLLVHSVSREPWRPYHEYANPEWVMHHLAANTYNTFVIPYSENTVILMRGDIYHETDKIAFEEDSIEAARHSLTFAFSRSATVRDPRTIILGTE